MGPMGGEKLSTTPGYMQDTAYAPVLHLYRWQQSLNQYYMI